MINFNGYDLSKDIKVTEIVRPILPPSFLTTSKVVGRSGDFFYYKQPGSLDILVKFILVEKNPLFLRSKIRSLAEKLDTEEPKRLIFSDEPDKYINAIIKDNTSLSETLSVGRGEINFYCPDPYWYAIQDDVIISDSPGVLEFTRKGTADSYPLIEIQGRNTGSITIENDDTLMVYNGELKENETLYLDSDLLTGYIIDSSGNTRSVVDKLSNLDFPVLKKGRNFLGIITGDGLTISNIKISCRSRWK